jgi:hypothetical protein
MAGEANRKIFFNNQNLDLSEGYRILLGGAPNVRDIINVNADTPQATTESFRLLLLLLRKERVNDGAPDSMFSLPRLTLAYLSTSALFGRY